jgi:hypothetical protein
LVEINGDGHRDILSGSYSRMEQDMAGLFQVLYGNPDGTFRKAEVLKGTDGQPLIIPIESRDQQTENICTRPFAVDWDADGHLDLVVGNFSGTFYWFKGEGEGKFQPKPQPLKAGSQPLRIDGAHSDPFVIDWDGDGDLDLLSGSSSGGVQFAENRAGKGKLPELRPFQWLIKSGRAIEHGQLLSEEQLTGPTTSTRVWADDVNGDGKLDLLVGDSVTLVSPAKGLNEAAFKKKFATWQKAYETVTKEMSQATDQAKRSNAQQEFQKLYQRRTEFMNEDRTGFVWLYLQK